MVQPVDYSVVTVRIEDTDKLTLAERESQDELIRVTVKTQPIFSVDDAKINHMITGTLLHSNPTQKQPARFLLYRQAQRLL